MNSFFLASLLALAFYGVRLKQQRRRLALLAHHLGQFQVEKLMELLITGYLRALGEPDGVRREQIWQLLASTEQQLVEQLGRFEADFATVPEAEARVSRIPVAIPWADRWGPRWTFDLRRAMSIHAEGIRRACQNDGQRASRDKAFMVTAELLLLQHTCHWFCRSRTTASARLLARHQTAYAQVLAAVGEDTRRAYLALVAKR